MDKRLSMGLDLGGDTLKIAFAYNDGAKIEYGKFAGKSKLTQIALPALAFYDQVNGKWIYGDQIAKSGGESFITVVKIKDLIALLSPCESAEVARENAKYYRNGNHFPKFFFPARRKVEQEFKKAIKDDETFEVEGYTPQDVCEEFFKYARALVDERIAELNAKRTVKFEGYKISIVHPSKVSDQYVSELERLVGAGFGVHAYKAFSANKALAIYALERKAVKPGEDFLVFDMGEESISVVRAGSKNGQPIIDGVDGHLEPINIGGNDVDEAIVRNLERSLRDRETIGTPSSGSEGHITEKGVYGKQYLFMKDIKKAKVIFSKPLKEDSIFANGVPVTLSWDLYIQRNLTKEDVEKSIGVSTNSGVAKEIVDYIIEEIKQPINHDIKKVFISGGLTETYSLLDYIIDTVKSEMPKIEILTFDDFKEKGDPFTILCYEDSVFSSAVGGAMVALKEIDIKTVIPLSFGTWLNVKNKPDIRYLDLFVERGTILPPEGATFYSSDFTLAGVGLTHGDELFSTHVVRQEIIDNCTKGKWLATDAKNLIIGKPNSKERKLAEKNVGLKVVSGGEDGKILLMYGGKQVSITKDSPAGILVREGMKIDGKGRATAIIENVSPATRSVRIIYVDKKGNASSGAIPISVNATKIVPVCTLGTIEDVTG